MKDIWLICWNNIENYWYEKRQSLKTGIKDLGKNIVMAIFNFLKIVWDVLTYVLGGAWKELGIALVTTAKYLYNKWF